MYAVVRQPYMELFQTRYLQKQSWEKLQQWQKQEAVQCNVVSWNRVSGAGRYRIYRKTASGSFQCIKEVENTRNTYHDFDIQGITSYTYAVRAVLCLLMEKKFSAANVPGEEILSYPSQQKISKIVRTACGSGSVGKNRRKQTAIRFTERQRTPPGKRSEQFPEGKFPLLRIRQQKREQLIITQCVPV